MISVLLMALACAGPLRADNAAAQALTATATAAPGADAEEGIYYGPDPVSAGADALPAGAQAASFLSHARITAFAWGAPQRALTGAEVVLNGTYLGTSPLELQGLLVEGGAPGRLALRLDGFSEGLRPALKLPAEGEVRVALLDDNAGAWISTPSWVLGLGLLAASVLAYRSESAQTGLGLAGGGIAVIAVSQLLLRWVAMPALRRAVRAYNARPEAAPNP